MRIAIAVLEKHAYSTVVQCEQAFRIGSWAPRAGPGRTTGVCLPCAQCVGSPSLYFPASRSWILDYSPKLCRNRLGHWGFRGFQKRIM